LEQQKQVCFRSKRKGLNVRKLLEVACLDFQDGNPPQVGGAFSGLNYTSLPLEGGGFWLVYSFVLEEPADRERPWTYHVHGIRPDGAWQDTGTVTSEGMPSLEPGESMRITLPIRFDSFTFEQAGVYQFQLIVDGELMANAQIELAPAPIASTSP
jgi:hypothetical protein